MVKAMVVKENKEYRVMIKETGKQPYMSKELKWDSNFNTLSGIERKIDSILDVRIVKQF